MDFEGFYIKWYSRVKSFAREYVLLEEEAENIVQDVFLEFYQKKDLLDFHVNIVAYLFTSEINVSIIYGVSCWSKKPFRKYRMSLTCLSA